MKKDEVRNATSGDLKKKVVELRKELIKLNAQSAMGTQLKSPGQIRQIRRNIARIVTEMKNKGEDAQV
jgi:large subunit ribosomal protein L29